MENIELEISLESVSGIYALVNITFVQWFTLWIIRIKLASFLAQCLMELKLYDKTHKISYVRDIANDVVFRSWIKIFLSPSYRWFNSLVCVSATDTYCNQTRFTWKSTTIYFRQKLCALNVYFT